MKNHIFAAMLLAFFGTVAKAGDFKIDISHYAKAGCELPSMEKGAVEYQDIIKNSTCRSKNHPFQSFLFKKHQPYWGNADMKIKDWRLFGHCDVSVFDGCECQGEKIYEVLDVTARDTEEEKECVDLGGEAQSILLMCDGVSKIGTDEDPANDIDNGGDDN